MATILKKAAPPVHTVRLGPVAAKVWANETSSGIRHNVTLRLGYKDGNEWKETSSIGRDHIYQAARALELAADWVFQQSGPDTGREA